MSYGSLAWGTSAPSNIKKLQVCQNKFLRIACDAPRYTNLVFLHDELGIESFTDFIKNMNTKKLQNANTHPNQLVTDSISYVPTHTHYRNRPKTILIPPPVP